MTGSSSREDPQPFPESKPVMIVEGMLLSESGVGALEGISLDGPVMLADRVGVFAHSFKCLDCRLEFVVFSWLPNRHRVGRTFCPECGVQAPMLHYRATLSEDKEMAFEDSGAGDSCEIFTCVPYGRAQLMNDTTLPG